MPRYYVNRSDGWPVSHTRESKYKLADEFESESADDATGVAQGYLLICGEPVKPPEGKTFPQLTPAIPDAPAVAGAVPLHLVKDEEPEPSGSPLPDEK